MSAYQVHPDTIDLLVTFYDSQRYSVDLDPQEVGTLLWKENHRSVAHRYGEDTNAPTPEPYTYRPVPAIYASPLVVLKSCACLEYQSCETDDYEQTDAYSLLTRIRGMAIAALGPGYDAAPWGWTRPTPAPEPAPTTIIRGPWSDGLEF